MASEPQPPSAALQAHILLQFKQAISKDPLGALHSWTNLSGDPNISLTPQFCSWFGITCDSQQHSLVVSIALPSCKLEGSITPFIGTITSLMSIDLSMNSLSGFVPQTLGMLPNLKTVKLASNSFVGSIPVSLSNCTLLVLLDISNNAMSGGIPAQLGALSTLKALLLSHNLLDGTLPPSIFNASALQFLDVSHNRITGVVPDVAGNARSILSLNLASNNLTGPIPQMLSEMVSLQGIDISDNLLNGGIPSQLSACTFLAVIILSNNLLVGPIPARLGKVQSLRVLQLNNNLLSGAIPSSLGNCMRLEDLVLSHNRFDGGIPTAVASLSNLLLSFDMSHNLLTGPIPPQISSMAHVLKINLSHNKLSGLIVVFSGCDGLEYLDLSSNQLKGPIPIHLFLENRLSSLTWMLNLSHNSLEGSIPEFQGLFYLRIVDLSHNELTGLDPSSLLSLDSLIFINLSFNRLNGCFPQVGTFVSKHINLSWIQGNPNLCVPSLSPFCSLHACSSAHLTSRAHNASYIWFLLLIPCFFFLGTGLVEHLKSRWFMITSEEQTSLELSIVQSKGFTIYSDWDLNGAINDIDTSSLIGSGASSDVYRVKFKGGQVCAVKHFKPTARQQHFNTELAVLTNFRHRNLVPMRGVCRQGTTRALILEYMESGSLKEKLHEMPTSSLDLERRLQVAKDVAEGLLYLHSSGCGPVIHRDVKPANILLDKEYVAHIADFGLAIYTVGSLTNTKCGEQAEPPSTFLQLQGTLGYIAPEYAAFKATPSIAGDVYSYGVVVLELLTRQSPGEDNFPPGFDSLPDLVLSASLHDKLESVLDPALMAEMRTKLDHDKVSFLASIGLACTNEDCSARPSMEQVVFSFNSFKQRHIFLEQSSENSGSDQAVNVDMVVEIEVAAGG